MEKDEVGCEASISSQSCLWRLYNLYGFGISRDFTYGVMHTVALCVFKKYVHMLVKYVEGNGKIKDLHGVLQSVKKLNLATFRTRWPRSR
jgi:hypothetical protein